MPRPAGWTRHRFPVLFRLSVAFLAAVTLGMSAGGAWAFLTGDPVAGALLAAGAAYIGHLVGLGTCVWRTRRRSLRAATLVPSPDGTTKGVMFGYSVWPYYWLTAVLVLTEVGLLAVTVASAASATAVGVVMAIVVAAIGLVIGWFLVTVLRRAPGEVTISPAGVFHRSLTYLHLVPWYAVVGVAARWLGTPIIAVHAYPSEHTGVRRYIGRFGTGELRFLPIMVIRTFWLATDPATVYHALSFYHAHPDLRAELATPDALDRISHGRAAGTEEP